MNRTVISMFNNKAIIDAVHNLSVYKQSEAGVLLEMDPTVCPTTTTTTTTTSTTTPTTTATTTTSKLLQVFPVSK